MQTTICISTKTRDELNRSYSKAKHTTPALYGWLQKQRHHHLIKLENDDLFYRRNTTMRIPASKMIQQQSYPIPDLVVNTYPTSCSTCAQVYTNNITGDKIVCHCRCLRWEEAIEALNLTDDEDEGAKTCTGSSNTSKGEALAEGEDS